MSSHHHGLQPNILKDASSGAEGFVAGEVATEQHLVGSQQLASHHYGAVSDDDITLFDQPDYDGYALPRNKLRVVLALMFLLTFLAALDTTVVTALLSTIANDLDAIGLVAWIATAYLLLCSAMQPIFGKLLDIFGRRIMMFGCCITFGIGCAMCATDSLMQLIIGRFITGLGGSGMTCLGTITMSDLIPLRDRGFYQGLANIFFGLGAASGGFIGGFVADWIGWKYVFTLQVPFALVAAVLIYKFLILPAGSPGLGVQGSVMAKLRRVDFAGSITLVLLLMCLLMAASLGGKEIAYLLATFRALCAASAVLLSAFVYIELYASDPIIPIHLLGNRTVIALSLANWFYSMGVFAYLFYVPFFFSSVMRMTATQTGVRMIPNFFAVSLGSVGAGLYMKRTGRYWNLAFVFGIILVLGVIRLFFLSPLSLLWTQFTIMLPPGFGYLVMLTVLLLALISAAPAKYQACTTLIQYTFRLTGSTIGVSIALAIFQFFLRLNLQSRIPPLVEGKKAAAKIIAKALANSDYVDKAPLQVRQAITDSYWMGCRGAFGFTVVTISLGAISSWFMREHTLHTTMSRD